MNITESIVIIAIVFTVSIVGLLFLVTSDYYRDNPKQPMVFWRNAIGLLLVLGFFSKLLFY